MSRRLLASATSITCSLAAASSFAADSNVAGNDLLDQVIVTATRATDGIANGVLGASVTVLSPQTLENRQVRVVSDVLRDVPGISVNRNGTVGGLTQVRIRGTEGNHVLVLIDGMEASDPYYGEFDFATLIADEGARIEVLRGQQSALYGSDAIGGVIHYMTQTGREAAGLRARVEGGSFGTYEAAGRFAGATDNFDYAINAGYQTTDGVPTARFGKRDVGAEIGVIAGRFQYDATDDFRIKAVTRYTQTNADSNDQSFNLPFGIYPYGYVVDSDDTYKKKAAYALVRTELESVDDRWLNALTLQGSDSGRDAYSDGARSFGNDGSRKKASYESSLRFGSDAFAQTLTGAVDFKREESRDTSPFNNAAQSVKRRIDNTGLVAQYNAVIDGHIGLDGAVRHDKNDRFKNVDTYRVQGSYMFETSTRLRAAAGSGIKNPSMTELFGFDPNTFLGNSNLKPERSEGWEVGVDQGFMSNSIVIGATYFDNKLKDEIFTRFSPTFISSPENRTTDSTQRGYELTVNARIGDAWTIDAAYTDLDAQENKVEEIRRPPHIGSLDVGWRTLAERLGLNLIVRYNGETFDNNYTGVGPARIVLSDYTLVNLGADFRITPSTQIYARVENLLDTEYEENYTTRTSGRAGYLGVRLGF